MTGVLKMLYKDSEGTIWLEESIAVAQHAEGIDKGIGMLESPPEEIEEVVTWWRSDDLAIWDWNRHSKIGTWVHIFFCLDALVLLACWLHLGEKHENLELDFLTWQYPTELEAEGKLFMQEDTLDTWKVAEPMFDSLTDEEHSWQLDCMNNHSVKLILQCKDSYWPRSR